MKGLKFKESVAVLLVLLFSYTAAGKLLEHARFVFQLRLSPLPQVVTFAGLLSWAVPFAELGITAILIVGIITGRFLIQGLWSSMILILSFEIYITAMFFSGKDLPCACGGIISLMSWKGHMIFNAITILLTGIALTGLYKNRSTASAKYSRV